jgi:hypothetical protein
MREEDEVSAVEHSDCGGAGLSENSDPGEVPCLSTDRPRAGYGARKCFDSFSFWP